MKVRGNKFAVHWNFMVQPASEPESLHSCVFSWGLVGQESRLCCCYQYGTTAGFEGSFRLILCLLVCVSVATNEDMIEGNKWTLL